MVDDAVETNPLSNPMVVDVDTPPGYVVNGQAADEIVIGEEPMITPCEQDEPPEHERVVVATEANLAGVPLVVVQYESCPAVSLVEVETMLT
jgi:hypothetical protein